MRLRKPRRFLKTFKPRFAGLVTQGLKTSTIRPTPKRPQDWPVAGDILDARQWMGSPYRSSQRKLGEFRITLVSPITIRARSITLTPPGEREPICVRVGARQVYMEFLDATARREGFIDIAEMLEWFQAQHSLPFTGIWIDWAPHPRAEASEGEVA